MTSRVVIPSGAQRSRGTALCPRCDSNMIFIVAHDSHNRPLRAKCGDCGMLIALAAAPPRLRMEKGKLDPFRVSVYLALACFCLAFWWMVLQIVRALL